MKKLNMITSNKIMLFPILILVASLFMGIGYASVNLVTSDIKGTANSKRVQEVFISEINYVGDTNANLENSKITAYQNNLNSTIVLSEEQSSTITYELKIHNPSNVNYIYFGTEYILGEKTYSNENITYSIEGIEEGDILTPYETKPIKITFKYNGSDTSNNTLISSINFNFEIQPILELSNENEVYSLSNIYPNYEEKEYQFIISNYNENTINEVEMNYRFEISIDKPLSAKIYDQDGNEVTGYININGDGINNIENNYTLKIYWNDENPEEGISYNSSDYENKQFNCVVTLIGEPVSESYKEYSLNKKFEVNASSASLIFNPTISDVIGMEKTKAQLPVTITNFDSNNNYNTYDITYEISMSGNDKFTYSIDSNTANLFERTIIGNTTKTDSYNVDFNGDVYNVSETETVNVNIKTTSPYIKEYNFVVTVKLQPLEVRFDANGGTVTPTTLTTYKGMNYDSLPTPTWFGHTFNGWYTAASGGTKITNATEVTSANITQTLYAHWTSRLLADKVEPGQLVNYDVGYSNVSVLFKTTTINVASGYTGWKVLDVVGEGDDKYVTLISSGIPLTFKCPYSTTDSSVPTTCVTALTTNFFSTAIASSLTDYKFYKNGFTGVTSISGLKTAFKNNVYTQLNSSGNPIVRAVTKADIDGSLATTAEIEGTTATVVANLTDFTNNTLFGIPSTSTTYSYVPYYIATKTETYYLWASYLSGYVVYTNSSYEHGIRPMVALKATTETTGQVNGVWQLKEGTE